MFRSSDRIGGIRTLLRRVSIGILLLVFSLDSAGQVTPVRAASNSKVVEFYQIQVFVPEPVCVGADRDLRVRVVHKVQEVRNKTMISQLEDPIGQAKVAAAPIDSSIVTVQPSFESLQTGWFSEGSNRAGEVTFTLHGVKAGKGSIALDVERPDGKAKTFTVNVRVVNCKYGVKMLYRRSVQGFSILGNMSTTIKGDGQQFAGSGIMDAKSTVAAVCGVTITDFLGPTDVTATSSPDGEQLSLAFQYHPATTHTSIQCPDAPVNFDHTEDPSAFLIASATLPSDGGTRTFAAPQGGSITITAQPEEEGAGS